MDTLEKMGAWSLMFSPDSKAVLRNTALVDLESKKRKPFHTKDIHPQATDAHGVALSPDVSI